MRTLFEEADSSPTEGVMMGVQLSPCGGPKETNSYSIQKSIRHLNSFTITDQCQLVLLASLSVKKSVFERNFITRQIYFDYKALFKSCIYLFNL